MIDTRVLALHPANRFRLMFGQPLLPESPPMTRDELNAELFRLMPVPQLPEPGNVVDATEWQALKLIRDLGLRVDVPPGCPFAERGERPAFGELIDRHTLGEVLAHVPAARDLFTKVFSAIAVGVALGKRGLERRTPQKP